VPSDDVNVEVEWDFIAQQDLDNLINSTRNLLELPNENVQAVAADEEPKKKKRKLNTDSEESALNDYDRKKVFRFYWF